MHRVLVHFKMVASKMRINSVIASSQLWYSKRFWCIETAITCCRTAIQPHCFYIAISTGYMLICQKKTATMIQQEQVNF